MKNKASVVQIDGDWYFEVKGKHTYQTKFRSKELAEAFLEYYKKYFWKKVIVKDDKDITEPVRVTEISFVYEDGEDQPPKRVLGVAWKHSRWYVPESRCVLV